MAPKLVYIAGPYTVPDCVENTHNAIKVADLLYDLWPELIVPVVPHLNLLWNLIRPHDVDYWLEYDLKLLARCDALLRLPGASTGADAEVKYADELEIPVFFHQSALIQWASGA